MNGWLCVDVPCDQKYGHKVHDETRRTQRQTVQKLKVKNKGDLLTTY